MRAGPRSRLQGRRRRMPRRLRLCRADRLRFTRSFSSAAQAEGAQLHVGQSQRCCIQETSMQMASARRRFEKEQSMVFAPMPLKCGAVAGVCLRAVWCFLRAVRRRLAVIGHSSCFHSVLSRTFSKSTAYIASNSASLPPILH